MQKAFPPLMEDIIQVPWRHAFRNSLARGNGKLRLLEGLDYLLMHKAGKKSHLPWIIVDISINYQ